jgi:hypothetical protein
MLRWLPTKSASFVARMGVALLRRLTRAEVLVEVRDTPKQTT